jgi:hypothetical protein
VLLDGVAARRPPRRLRIEMVKRPTTSGGQRRLSNDYEFCTDTSKALIRVSTIDPPTDSRISFFTRRSSGHDHGALLVDEVPTSL